MNKKTILLGLLITTLWLAGCGNLGDQPKLGEPYAESPTFGQAARVPLPEAVPVDASQNPHFYAGTVDGEPATTFPFEITEEVMRRGQRQYDAYCSACHGFSGYGNGVISEEGYPKPASYHTERLRNETPGYLFQVITDGVGNMYSYEARVPAEDRWAIVAYIRALQFSQYASFEELPPDLQAQFDALLSQ